MTSIPLQGNERWTSHMTLKNLQNSIEFHQHVDELITMDTVFGEKGLYTNEDFGFIVWAENNTLTQSQQERVKGMANKDSTMRFHTIYRENAIEVLQLCMKQDNPSLAKYKK